MESQYLIQSAQPNISEYSRELALARMKDFGSECRDVRTREVGIQEIHNKVP